MSVHSIPAPGREPFPSTLDTTGQEALRTLENLRLHLVADPRLAAISRQVEKVEGLLRSRCRQGPLMRQVANVLGSTDRPEQLASLVLDVLLSELGTSRGVVWVLGEQDFQALDAIGMDRGRLASLRLPVPQPFPGYPIFTYQCQALERDLLPSAVQIIQGQASDELLFVPFEHHMLLVGFAVLALPRDAQLGEADSDSLEVLQRLFAAGLYNAWLVRDLECQRERLTARTEELRKEAERLDQQNQALRQGQTLRVDFLEYASQELRGQLTRILSVVTRVHQDTAMPSTERDGLLLDGLLVGKHMAELLRDLGELARPEKGGPSDRPGPVDTNALLRELRAVVDGFPRRTGGDILWPSGVDLPDVLADESALRQILMSLCAGALGASVDGSLALWIEREPDMLTFCLHIEGLELGEEGATFSQRRPLQPEELYLRTGGGAGLGLVICRQLLDSMGGALRLEPHPDATGSIVSLDLPLA